MTWPVVLMLAVAAFVIGVSKTSVGGFASLAVSVFALALPAKESTAAVLLLLIVGDLMGVYRYRRSCDWTLLVRLLPAVLPGIALGAVFMAKIDDDRLMRHSIGGVIAVMVVLQIILRITKARSGTATVGARGDEGRTSTPAALTAGVAAGFATMTANAAAPVMTLYFLAERVDKLRFIGTNAWFFLLVNVSKVPFSAAMGLFPATTLTLTVLLTPVVLVGTMFGMGIARRLSQTQFENVALAASLVAVSLLLLR